MNGFLIFLTVVLVAIATATDLDRPGYEATSENSTRGQFPFTFTWTSVRALVSLPVEVRLFLTTGFSLPLSAYIKPMRLKSTWARGRFAISHDSECEKGFFDPSSEILERKTVEVSRWNLMIRCFLNRPISTILRLFCSDIALVRLPYTIPISKFTSTVSLPSQAQYYSNAIAIGNGITIEDGDELEPILQFNNLRVLPHGECSTAMPFLGSKKYVLCGKALKQSSKCSGDFGGPLVSITNGTLVGINSFVSTQDAQMIHKASPMSTFIFNGLEK